MKVEIRKLNLEYQNQILLNDLSCIFEKGKVSCLLGKSGSGKTSILKIIAGLETNYNGTIYLNGIDATSIPIKDRNIGWVPQQQLLFPNKSVEQNVEFGLKIKKWDKSKRKDQMEYISKLTGIQALLDRDVSRLSGGEKQRVALARALAPEPNLLLLDEPFSSLDAPERERFALLFREIQIETGITTIHVTHSPREAEVMSDLVYVLTNKQIGQFGSVQELFNYPQSIEIAQLLNIPNVVKKDVLGEHTDMIIPTDAILVNDVGLPVKVISTARKSIFVLTSDKITLEMNTDKNQYKVGDEIKISINFDECLSLGK